MVRFAYAKIGTGNSEFDEYLSLEASQFVPIYFGDTEPNEQDFLKNGGAKEQGRLFFEFGRENKNKYIVVSTRGRIYVYQPTGPVVFRDQADKKSLNRWVKLLPVVNVASIRSSDAPPILAGMNSNRYYSSGTFREITSPGNIAALNTIINHTDDTLTPTLKDTLGLLGSVELETLVARLLEEHGLFVPAYRGGTMQDVDLFAHNDSDSRFDCNEISIDANTNVSIQIKTKSTFISKPDGVDYVICIDGIATPWQVTHEWFPRSLQSCPMTSAWLRRSLRWAPDKYLQTLPRNKKAE